MAPVIVESRILSHEGGQFRVWLRLQERAVLPAVFDLIFRITYRRPSVGRLEIESGTESIHEVPGVGAPRGAAARDRGLLWALNHDWRFEERDAGLYVECEALVLSRAPPPPLRWIADPLIPRASRRTLDGTVENTIRMVQRQRCGVSGSILARRVEPIEGAWPECRLCSVANWYAGCAPSFRSFLVREIESGDKE